MVEVGIGLGSNLGDRAGNLAAALHALSSSPGVRLLRHSQIYATVPWGDPDQPDFLNAAALVETSLSPESLLRSCKAIEAAVGRSPSRRWGPREIDIDLLFFGDLERQTEDLTLPHKGMFGRLFVLVPLKDVVTGGMIAGRNLDDAIAALLDANEGSSIRPDSDATARLKDVISASWGRGPA